MEYEIRNDIPVPAKRGGKGYRAAVLRLEPGESVLLPTTYNSGRAIVADCYAMRNRARGEFTVREVAGGVRIWRNVTDVI